MATPPSRTATRSSTRNYLPTSRSACDKKLPCAFCKRSVDDELIYGKFYTIGDIQCHYSCVHLSANLHHNGESHEGLHGFLYSDILAEIERSKDVKCSYCCKGGATLCCDVSKCDNDFHFSCAKERHAVFMTCGRHRTFCEAHAPNHDPDTKLTLKRPCELNNKTNTLKKAIDSEELSYQDDCEETFCTLLAKRSSKDVLKRTNILNRNRRSNLEEHDYVDDSNDFLVARYSVNVDSAGGRRKRTRPRKRQKELLGQHIVLDDKGAEKMYKEIRIGRKTKFVSQDRKKKTKPLVQPSKPNITIETRSVSRKGKLVKDKDLKYEVLEREDDCNVLILKM